jgi:hypothetical protein
MKPSARNRAAKPAAPAVAPSAPEPAKHDLVMLAPTPELNPRNKAAAEIAARANADSDAAAKEVMPAGDGENEPVEVAAPTEPPPAEPTGEETIPQAAAPAETAPAAPAPAATLPGIKADDEYEFVIDGVPTKIKGSQVIARVQKGEAADYRLNLASRLLEEAKRTIAPQQLPPQGAAPQQPNAPKPVELDDAQLAHYIQFGTTEQAAEALKQLRAQRPDTVTKEGLQGFMAQLPRIVETQLAFREGLTFVQKEYGDLLNDPYLRQLFFHKENEMRKAGDKRAHSDIYKDIGEDLRKHFNRPAPSAASAPASAAPTTPAAPTIAQKQAAKAAAPAAPKLASVRLDGGGGRRSR